jgi:hypothetical protein
VRKLHRLRNLEIDTANISVYIPAIYVSLDVLFFGIMAELVFFRY